MSSFKHPRVLSWPLTIRRGEAQLKATQVIVFDDPASHLVEFAAEFLGPTENAYFSTLRFARRQQSYVLGRYARSWRCEIHWRSQISGLSRSCGAFSSSRLFTALEAIVGV
jgi:hypothetical protein